MKKIMYGNYLNDWRYTITTGDALSPSWFKSITQFLFQMAAEGIENRQLYAYIYTESKVDLVEAFTVVNGSQIDCKIYVNDQFVRNMNIAY